MRHLAAVDRFKRYGCGRLTDLSVMGVYFFLGQSIGRTTPIHFS